MENEYKYGIKVRLISSADDRRLVGLLDNVFFANPVSNGDVVTVPLNYETNRPDFKMKGHVRNMEHVAACGARTQKGSTFGMDVPLSPADYDGCKALLEEHHNFTVGTL